ncbi:TPA: motility associated factor glycosyltransferase family protein, partial [Campylobacter lari]|nr:motility associated factor glycosyltransferase family protein [Campylobacter lari]
HKNIILIGQDLAYDENGNSHPKEYLHTQESENDRKEGLFITAYGGNGKVETNQWWILFKESLEYSIDTNSITTYNATEGGARIEGSIEKSFKELCENLLKENKPLFEKLQTLSEKEIQDKKDKIDECLKGVLNTNILEQIQNFKDNLQNITSDIKKSFSILELDFSKILKINEEIHEFKISFEKDFALLGEVLVPALKNVELELAKIYLMPAISQEDKKTRMILWILKQEEWFEILQSTLINFYSAISRENQ